MKKLLITYFTESGSTQEIAEIIAQNLPYESMDVLSVSEVQHLNYDAVVIGTPNWYGKPTPKVVDFIKKYEKELSALPVAFFFSCMDCYQTKKIEQPEVYCDSYFKDQIIDTQKLSSWEKSHAVDTYFSNLQKVSNQLNIQSIAFFKGRLDFKKISFFNALVMRFICLINKKIKPGNYYKKQDVVEWSKKMEVIFLGKDFKK